eukprot:gnl/MRDRNA2_/MRDRNA2_358818_c0_seq1.p1 gnl/MRDRNA2_/MRDRNA2_358818_c0~~gnl/MRDRNA2_/MRDRNA2_358818_c0_seq1.p1  ORF type:complete len:121 (-),score=13.00 gnl/MRDRNA2_/MRDRNA2_358818_c0_seq1:10-372(-)
MTSAEEHAIVRKAPTAEPPFKAANGEATHEPEPHVQNLASFPQIVNYRADLDTRPVSPFQRDKDGNEREVWNCYTRWAARAERLYAHAERGGGKTFKPGTIPTREERRRAVKDSYAMKKN